MGDLRCQRSECDGGAKFINDCPLELIDPPLSWKISTKRFHFLVPFPSQTKRYPCTCLGEAPRTRIS